MVGCVSIEEVCVVLVVGLVSLVIILLMFSDGDGLVLVWLVCEIVG